MSVWVPSVLRRSSRRRQTDKHQLASLAAETDTAARSAAAAPPPTLGDKGKLLRQMDATVRCIISLGRPSGCGMPGSVAAAPLAQLLAAATAHMHQHSSSSSSSSSTNTTSWSFVDIGAGAGRMVLAAAMFGASSCAGLELCNLTHTFEACKARCLKKGLLPPSAARSCTLHVGDASHYSSSSALLLQQQQQGPAAAAAAAGGGPVMVSLIDEGMPMGVREHAYSRVAQDPRVCVVVTVNYRSRAGHLPAVLARGGFQLVQEMPAPLIGGKCSTAGRIYVRQRTNNKQQRQQPKQPRQQPKQPSVQMQAEAVQQQQPEQRALRERSLLRPASRYRT